MAIFNNNDHKHQSSKETSSTTIITIGSTIKGEMNVECNLYVDGVFDGTINSSKEVTVGKNGKITGEVYAKHLIVQGEVSGTVCVDLVEIKPHGKINGSVESNELVIEPKGLFEGNSIIKKKENNSKSSEDIKKS